MNEIQTFNFESLKKVSSEDLIQELLMELKRVLNLTVAL